jgi:hypothetical protein
VSRAPEGGRAGLKAYFRSSRTPATRRVRPARDGSRRDGKVEGGGTGPRALATAPIPIRSRLSASPSPTRESRNARRLRPLAGRGREPGPLEALGVLDPQEAKVARRARSSGRRSPSAKLRRLNSLGRPKESGTTGAIEAWKAAVA